MSLLGRSGLDPSGPLERPVVALVALLGALLIIGYVILAAIGRDTTGYILFVGGPAMTSLVGLLINRRVAAVAATVETVREQAAVLADVQVPAIHDHLSDQDVALAQVLENSTAAPATSPADSPAASTIGRQRSSEPSTWHEEARQWIAPTQ